MTTSPGEHEHWCHLPTPADLARCRRCSLRYVLEYCSILRALLARALSTNELDERFSRQRLEIRPIASGERGPSARGPLVFWSVLTVAAAAVGGFIASYYQWYHYEPKALRYLPYDAQLVARVDVEAHVLFAPFRRHFFPLLPQGPSGDGANRGLLTRLREQTGLNLGRDLRELVFARGAEPSRWVLLMGGVFRHVPDLPQHLQMLLNHAGPEVATPAADGDSLVLPGALTLGQTSDGVLVLASSPELYAEVLRGSSRARQLGLDTQSPLWLTVTSPLGLRDTPLQVENTREGRQLTARLYQHSNPRLQVFGEDHGAPLARTQLLAWAAAGLAPFGLKAAPVAAPTGGEDERPFTVWLEWSEQATDQVLAHGAGVLASLVTASFQTARPP